MSKLRSLFENKNRASRAWSEVIILKNGNFSTSVRAGRLLLWPFKLGKQ